MGAERLVGWLVAARAEQLWLAESGWEAVWGGLGWWRGGTRGPPPSPFGAEARGRVCETPSGPQGTWQPRLRPHAGPCSTLEPFRTGSSTPHQSPSQVTCAPRPSPLLLAPLPSSSPSSASLPWPLAAPPRADAANPAPSPCPVPGQCSHGPVVSVPSVAGSGAQPHVPGFGPVGSQREFCGLGI